jgi:hypothetical protein
MLHTYVHMLHVCTVYVYIHIYICTSQNAFPYSCSGRYVCMYTCMYIYVCTYVSMQASVGWTYMKFQQMHTTLLTLCPQFACKIIESLSEKRPEKLDLSGIFLFKFSFLRHGQCTHTRIYIHYKDYIHTT